jgi:hypothetical protein
MASVRQRPMLFKWIECHRVLGDRSPNNIDHTWDCPGCKKRTHMVSCRPGSLGRRDCCSAACWAVTALKLLAVGVQPLPNG